MSLASIYIPAPSLEEGKRIARILLEKRYVACVNIVENATSMYLWEGEMKEEAEVLLICKTLMRTVRHIIKDIKEMHPYDLPAVTAEPILKVNAEYARWVEEVIDGGNFQMAIFLTGSLCYDRIMPFPGKFQEHILPDKIHTLNVSFMVNGLQEMRGGTAGNIAYSLALLGEHPTVVATAGGKDFDPYAEAMDSLGLPLDGIRRVEDEFTGGCYIFTDMTNNQITGFNPGALKYATSYDFGGVDAAQSFACVSPGNVDDMTEYPERYKKMGISYFFDPGQQIPVLSGKQMLAAIDGAYALVSNDYELEMVMKATGKTVAELLQLTDRIIVTLGEHGSRIITKDGQTDIPAVKAQVIKDPTGAGDAFRAGVIKGLVSGKSLEESCRIGAVAAVYCVEQSQPQGHSFTQDEFWKRYAANFG